MTRSRYSYYFRLNGVSMRRLWQFAVFRSRFVSRIIDIFDGVGFRFEFRVRRWHFGCDKLIRNSPIADPDMSEELHE